MVTLASEVDQGVMKMVAWYDESYFTLHHVNDSVYMPFTWGRDGPGGPMGKRQAGRGSVMFRTMLCWKNLCPDIHVDS